MPKLDTKMPEYVGQSGRSFHDRIREHMYSIVKAEKTIGIYRQSPVKSPDIKTFK